jgi:hypothetical protein
MTPQNTKVWPLTVTRPIRRPIKGVRGTATASLPGWFTANRVHGHTRLLLRLWGDKPEADAAAAHFKALGAEAFTRHAKSGDEDPPWPAGDPFGSNVVKEFIDRAHAEGLRIFTYYWHMSEKSLEAPHPEWVCKNRDGTTIEGDRGVQLDITGPYREVVLSPWGAETRSGLSARPAEVALASAFPSLEAAFACVDALPPCLSAVCVAGAVRPGRSFEGA